MTPEQILSDLIRLDTTNPPGNETAAAEYLRELFDEAGIAGEIIEPEKGRGSFIAELGRGPGRLLFLSHTDVVPASEGWDFDPFGGEIEGGIVHGRGALDCKGLVAAQAAAVLTLAREGLPLDGTLVFAATADEERGGACGVRYLLEQMPAKLQADFAVNEGAEEPVLLDGKMVYFIQVGEKGTSWSRLKTSGSPCHGSVPTLGDNAVMKMVRALASLDRYEPEVKFIPEVQYLLQELARLKGFDGMVTADSLGHLLDCIEDRSFAESLRAMTRMTVSPNVIQGGSKTNVVPDSCSTSVDIRVLPGQGRSYVLQELRHNLGEDVAVEIPRYQSPTFSASDSRYYRLIEEVTAEVTGGKALCLPVISTGSTDSRFLRRAGIPAYGVGHMAPGFDPGARAMVHGRNERIDIASLRLKTHFFVSLVRKYLCGSSENR